MADHLAERLRVLDQAVEEKEAQLQAATKELFTNREDGFLLKKQERLLEDLANLKMRQEKMEDAFRGWFWVGPRARSQRQ
jgi:hypothetical protein